MQRTQGSCLTEPCACLLLLVSSLLGLLLNQPRVMKAGINPAPNYICGAMNILIDQGMTSMGHNALSVKCQNLSDTLTTDKKSISAVKEPLRRVHSLKKAHMSFMSQKYNLMTIG